MMLTVINLTKIFTRGENKEVVFFKHLYDQFIDSTLKTVPGGLSFGNLEVFTFNFRNTFYKVIK